MTEFSSIESDITNKVAMILIDNDLDTLERFLEFLREKDDWRKVKSVADALFSVEDWKSRVTEEAQDYVLDAVSEYIQKVKYYVGLCQDTILRWWLGMSSTSSCRRPL